MKYRKTELVDAEQFDGSDEMIKKYDIEDLRPPKFIYSPSFIISTHDGRKTFLPIGDWIATDANGERWTFTDEYFKQTYEPVEEKAMKIKLEQLFNSKLDLRKYLNVYIRDEDRESLSYYHDIPDWVIDEVLDCVQIYVNGSATDKEVELPK